MVNELFFMAIRFFLTSIIFIIGAYIVERIQSGRKKSEFPEHVKNVFVILSILSLIAFVLSAVFLKFID